MPGTDLPLHRMRSHVQHGTVRSGQRLMVPQFVLFPFRSVGAARGLMFDNPRSQMFRRGRTGCRMLMCCLPEGFVHLIVTIPALLGPSVFDTGLRVQEWARGPVRNRESPFELSGRLRRPGLRSVLVRRSGEPEKQDNADSQRQTGADQ